MTTATNVKQRHACPPLGTFSGVWGGYLVAWTADGLTYEATTSNGIRTPSAPCVVIVAADGIKVELNKAAP